jgi:hypothetical protein
MSELPGKRGGFDCPSHSLHVISDTVENDLHPLGGDFHERITGPRISILRLPHAPVVDDVILVYDAMVGEMRMSADEDIGICGVEDAPHSPLRTVFI